MGTFKKFIFLSMAVLACLFAFAAPEAAAVADQASTFFDPAVVVGTSVIATSAVAFVPSKTHLASIDSLTTVEINIHAQRLADEFNLPFLKEGGEKWLFAALIFAAENFSIDQYGRSLKQLVGTGEDHIVDLSKIAEFINKEVNIPLMGEKQEGQLIEAILTSIKDQVEGRLFA